MALRLSLRNSRNFINIIKTTRNISSSSILINVKKSQQQQQQQKIQQQACLLINQKRFYAATGEIKQADVQEKVLNIFKNFDRIKENPARPQVTLESHVIKDLGLDSLDHVEIIVQLEDTFGFEIPDSDYEKLYSPKEIVNYVLKRSETTTVTVIHSILN